MSSKYTTIAVAHLSALVLMSTRADAAESTTGGFWGGVELGAGNVRRATDTTRKDATFYMAFKVGYAVSERLLFGVQLGGHTLEAGDLWDSSEGEGVSEVFLVAQYHLQPMREGWYVKGGGGYVSYWNNSPGGLEDDGWGAQLGIGHDWRTERFGALGPLIMFDYGKARDIDHRAVALALSWSFP